MAPLHLTSFPCSWCPQAGMRTSCLGMIQGEPLIASDRDKSWWSHRQLFSGVFVVLGLHAGFHVGHAGTTRVRHSLAGSSPPSPVLVRHPLLAVTGDPHEDPGQFLGEGDTGQVWHECEAGSHSTCQVISAVTQSWKPCQSIRQAGPGGTGVCLAVAPATCFGPSWDSPLSKQHGNEEAPQALSQMCAHNSCGSQQWPLQSTSNFKLSHS